jgi:hypothetical protein
MARRSSYGNSAGPATGAVAVTPNDSTVVDFAALYVGGAGTVTVTTLNASGADADVLFTGVPAGTILPVHCSKVKSTGTTATSIVGLI